MTGKIFRSMLAACGLVLVLGMLLSFYGFSRQMERQNEQQLSRQLILAAAGVEAEGRAYLEHLSDPQSRLTWIDPTGAVLYDTAAPAEAMENHAQREEVRLALLYGLGRSTRYSETLLEKTVYHARRLADGSVLRISYTHATAAAQALGLLGPLCVVVALSMVLAFLLSKRLARRIVRPLGTLDLDHPLDNDTYEELSPLLHRISRQGRELTAQQETLRQEKAAFDQITAQMQEGLILLDKTGKVLAINPAGEALFHGGAAAGDDLLALERTRGVSAALTQALKTGHAQRSIQRQDRTYQLSFSAISPGSAAAVVLLALDVTERTRAEAMRREFTANVSHELKTPLTAILGSAELLAHGMVAPEDLPRFAGHIHTEASRLLTLMEDILQLSQLDEGAELPREPADIALLTRQAADPLRPVAAERSVALSFDLSPCPVETVPRLVQEIAGNLIENAIKYNVPQGQVTVTVKRSAREAVLTVADQGLGIAPEHMPRVFERFYRVDKSHSRESGGTGLGLSIVKHAAAYLGAEVRMDSAPGKGTTVTVVFPVGEGSAQAGDAP